MTAAGEGIRREALRFLGELETAAKTADRQHPHCVIEGDPETGLVQVFGSYPDADAAGVYAVERAAMHHEKTGPPAMVYAVALYHDMPEQTPGAATLLLPARIDAALETVIISERDIGPAHLVCTKCDDTLSDAEDADTLAVLASVALNHMPRCAGTALDRSADPQT